MKRRTFMVCSTAVVGASLGFGCSDDDDDDNGGTGGTGGGAGSGGSGGRGGSGGTGGLAGAAGAAGEGGAGGASVCESDIEVTSTVEDGHDHDVVIPLDDILDGSAGTYTFTTVNGHTHTISLTSADLQKLSDGAVVTKESTETEGHTHDVLLTCLLL